MMALQKFCFYTLRSRNGGILLQYYTLRLGNYGIPQFYTLPCRNDNIQQSYTLRCRNDDILQDLCTAFRT